MRISESQHRVELPGGGSVEVRSGDDPDTAGRGPGWDGVVMDEAAFVKQQLWYTSLRPALADRQGWAVFFSTPNGFNWFKDLFDKAGVEDGWGHWQRPTSDNPLVPASELESALRDMGPRAFGQEHEALFTEMEGAEWPENYMPSLYDELPDQRYRFKVLALDPSKGKNAKTGDFSAMGLILVDPQMHLWVDDCWLKVVPVDQVEDQAVAMLEAHQDLNAFIVECNGFQERVAANILRKAQAKGLQAPVYQHVNTENKQVRIRMALTPLLSQHRIHLRNTPANRLGLTQLREFPIAQAHDDFPDMLTLGTSVINHLLSGRRQAAKTILQVNC